MSFRCLILMVSSAAALALFSPASTHAKDGYLEPSWGAGGRLLYDLGPNNDNGTAMVVQPNGKFVMAGTCTNAAADKNSFCVTRRNADGQADTTFGSNGSGTTLFDDTPGISIGSTAPRGLALQPDGRIVLAGVGFFFCDGSLKSSAFVRLSAAGAIESSGGRSCWSFEFSPNNGGTVKAIAVQPNGKLLAAGDVSFFLNTSDFAVARFNADFTPDTSFGSGGGVTLAFSAAGRRIGEAGDILVLPDGKILAAGRGTDPNGKTQGVLVRFNADGSLDSGFGNVGIAQIDASADCPRSNWFSVVKLDARGRIAAGGGCDLETGDPAVTIHQFLVARFDAQGRLDSGFSGNGYAIFDGFVGANSKPDEVKAIFALDNGKTIAVGPSTAADGSTHIIAARLRASGTPDRLTFGTDGISRDKISFGPGDPTPNNDYAGAAVLSQGGLFVGGRGTYGDVRFGLAKVQLDEIFSDGFER